MLVFFEFLFWTVLISGILIYAVSIYPMPPNIAKKIEKESERKTALWNHVSNVVSVFHAIIVFVISGFLIYTNGVNYTSESYPAMEHFFIFSSAYFTSDFILGIIKKYNDIPMHVHHIFTILSVLYGATKGRYGDNILWALFITEISNPFLLLSKICENDPKNEKYVPPLLFTFAILFLAFRTYIAGILILPMQAAPVCLYLKLNCAIICKIIRVYIFVLGVYHNQ